MDTPPATGVTRLLREWRGGDRHALEQLMPLVYDELRRLASGQMRGERPDHTLQPTALVHEAFARLVDANVAWEDRAHFLGVSARVMRQVLVEHARTVGATKRGGDRVRVTMQDSGQVAPQPWDMIDLNQALESLAEIDERQARVIELRYLGGLTYDEIAEATGTSRATVERDLRHGRAWLKVQLKRR